MTTEDQVRRKARVLAAFMSQSEAVGYARSFALDPQGFIQEWAQRAGARSRLAAGYTAPRIADLPRDADAHLAELTAHPAFAKTFKAPEFKLIELGRCIAHQHWMDTDVSEGLAAASSGAPSFAEMLERCLPVSLVPATRTLWTPPEGAPGERVSLTTYSLNNTLGFEHQSDPKTGRVQFLITAAANLMIVVEHQGRYVLMNGYHRAWWLRARGVEMVPVCLQRASSPQEIADEIKKLAKPGFIQPEVLLSDRPPLIEHFLDDALAVTVDIRAMMRVIRITAEVLTVPRLLF